MTKADLINEMVKKGISNAFAQAIINPYLEISSFTYSGVQNSTDGRKYVKTFGAAYSNFGIYIFYVSGTYNIKYVGEAASEAFSKRLTQHFNSSHGGLPHKKQHSIQTLNGCDVLILYGKYNKMQSRETHFDEDLLIGLFRPDLNDR